MDARLIGELFSNRRVVQKGFRPRVPPGAFRLFLAFTVLVCHSCRANLGTWGVDTFFVLSGYWIHQMWVRKYAEARHPYGTFLLARALRLLPVFWLAGLIAGLTQAAINPAFLNSTGSWSWPAVVFTNVAILGYARIPHSVGALDPAWSLDVEFQFYLLAPLLFAAMDRSRTRRPVVILAWAAALFGLALAAFRPSDATFHGLMEHASLFLAGVGASAIDWRPGPRWVFSFLVVWTLLVAACVAHSAWRPLLEGEKHVGALPIYAYSGRFQFVLAGLSIPFAIYTVHQPSGSRDRICGDLSYILYLIHWPIMMLHQHFFEYQPPAERIGSVAGAWLIVAGATLLIFRYYDRPIERFRRRLIESRTSL